MHPNPDGVDVMVQRFMPLVTSFIGTIAAAQK
jgi:acyl-CoA thioesterase-1